MRPGPGTRPRDALERGRWALVGDAGYNKDFITGQGIHDAFHDAELVATALGETFSGSRRSEDAMHTCQSRRDEQVLPMYGFTNDIAALAPPPPELQQLLAAAAGNQEAMDGFCRVAAGVTSPAGVLLGRERGPHPGGSRVASVP